MLVACSECEKLMNKFVRLCSDIEANALTSQTFRAFCESGRQDKNPFNINYNACLILNAKLASKTGDTGADMVDPTKPPNICMKYKNGNFFIKLIHRM